MIYCRIVDRDRVGDREQTGIDEEGVRLCLYPESPFS
jgi:hypothetical protein